MVFLEVVALLVVASVLITVIISVGKPVAEMLADKSRFKFKALDSQAEARLVARIEALEEELRQTNKRLADVKDASDFAVKMIENRAESLEIAESINVSEKVVNPEIKKRSN